MQMIESAWGQLFCFFECRAFVRLASRFSLKDHGENLKNLPDIFGRMRSVSLNAAGGPEDAAARVRARGEMPDKCMISCIMIAKMRFSGEFDILQCPC